MRTLWSRLRALGRRWRRRGSWEQSAHDELQSFVEHDIDSRIEAGMSPSEARRAALADFGGVEQVKEHMRSSATAAWLDTLGQDFRYACRGLLHSRRFTIWVVGSISIGLATTITGLAFLIATLTAPFPGITAQDRLVRMSVLRNCGRPDCWTPMSSPTDYAALSEHLTGLQGLAGYTQGEIAVGLPEARSMQGAVTTGNYFEVLGVRPAAGRTFDRSDSETNAAVAVISHSVWTREFGASPSVIGRSIRVANDFVQIVGVAPPLFGGIDRERPWRQGPDVWLPLWLVDRVLPLTNAEQSRKERYLFFVGRLRDGVEVAQAQAETELLAQGLAEQRGRVSQPARAEVRRVWRVNPENWHVGVIVLMPIPILVLVIACVNAANLMLARGSQRQREIAVRVAIGASRVRIIRQLLFESGFLAFVATVLAVLMAWASLRLASTPLNFPVPFNTTVLVFSILTAAITTLAFGLAPAIRISAQVPFSVLGSASARSDVLPRQSRMRRVLMGAQMALSIGLLVTGWQLVSTVRLQAVSGGTAPDRLFIARFNLRPLASSAGEAQSFYGDLLAGASRLPGVTAAGGARHTSVWTFGQGTAPGSLMVWVPTDAPEEGRVTIGGYAGGDLFEAVGVRTLAGRGFVERDRQGLPRVAVVNQSFAESLNAPALGSTLRVAPRNGDFNSSLEVQIVGIIEPTVEPRLTPDGPPAPKVYLPSPIELEPALALYLRTNAAAAAQAQPVRNLVHEINPRVPIQELGSLQEFNERSFGTQLWLARAAALLGFIGLLLASAGLYGISSYVVAMRSREIAIRMAIGARGQTILAMMLRQTMQVAGIGLLVGGGVAVAVGRVIQAGYHGIQGIDGLAFAGASAVFLVAMLLASVIPAVRASRLDPVENLKEG